MNRIILVATIVDGAMTKKMKTTSSSTVASAADYVITLSDA